jgi:hypothetical protein
MRTVLIEGPPGSGKSSILRALNSPGLDAFLLHEFHSKRRVVHRGYGLFRNGKRLRIRDSRTAGLEDRLEDMILDSRFIDVSSEFEDLKLRLLNSRLDFMSSLPGPLVIKEGLLSCLIDRCSDSFISSAASVIKPAERIFFLNPDAGELLRRQGSRFRKRGKYDDRTPSSRVSVFNTQFREVARLSGADVIYLNPAGDIRATAMKIRGMI